MITRPLLRNVAPWPCAYGPLFVGPTPVFNPPPLPPQQHFQLTPVAPSGKPVTKRSVSTGGG